MKKKKIFLVFFKYSKFIIMDAIVTAENGQAIS